MAKRNDVSIKIGPEALRVAKLLAIYEDRHVSDLVTEITLEAVIPRLERHEKARAAAGAKPPAKKGK